VRRGGRSRHGRRRGWRFIHHGIADDLDVLRHHLFHELRDDDGLEATRFGVITSGQTVLYDPSGALLFSGGITGARGHAGDNAGRASLVSLLNQGKTDLSSTSVFGCPLFAFLD